MDLHGGNRREEEDVVCALGGRAKRERERERARARWGGMGYQSAEKEEVVECIRILL